MAERFSPTGYWAIYLFSDEFLDALNERRKGKPKADSVAVLPVVTWTPEGEAAVFDGAGCLTPVSRLYLSRHAEFVIDHKHPEE